MFSVCFPFRIVDSGCWPYRVQRVLSWSVQIDINDSEIVQQLCLLCVCFNVSQQSGHCRCIPLCLVCGYSFITKHHNLNNKLLSECLRSCKRSGSCARRESPKANPALCSASNAAGTGDLCCWATEPRPSIYLLWNPADLLC